MESCQKRIWASINLPGSAISPAEAGHEGLGDGLGIEHREAAVLLLALGEGLDHPLALLGQIFPRFDRIPLFHRPLP